MSEESKVKRTRSPAYPAIDLEEAIAKATTLWEKNNRHAAAIETASTQWGYEKNSSAAMSVASAMLKYGLISDEGTGASRAIKLTEDAIRLIFNPDTSSQEHQAALKRAALLPKIHAELWRKYGGITPDDSVVQRYLVVDRKFNEQYVDGFIKQFKKTIKFANLVPGDKVPTVQVESTDESEEPEPMSTAILKKNAPPPARPAAIVPPMQQGMDPNIASYLKSLREPHEASIPLGEGRYAKVPFPMSKDDFDMFLETLKLWERKLVSKTAVLSLQFPIKATWKNAHNDKPITIVAEMGEKDGVKFFQSEDGTGIPATELIFQS